MLTGIISRKMNLTIDRPLYETVAPQSGFGSKSCFKPVGEGIQQRLQAPKDLAMRREFEGAIAINGCGLNVFGIQKARLENLSSQLKTIESSGALNPSIEKKEVLQRRSRGSELQSNLSRRRG